jgi:Kef-type K+ transport system membrane component KefB
VLAIVLATFGGDASVAIKAIVGAFGFAAFVLGPGRRLLRPLGERAEREQGLSQGLLAIVLMAFLFSAFVMDWAGMHAVFGGFLLGVAMPRGRLAEELRAKLEPITVVLLLPMFFTYSGLNTKLDLIASPALLGVTVVLLAASILAKFGACWAAARLTGQDNRTALGIGALMNARGLMELIILNIGLQKGIIGVELFSIMVLMAVVTTLMASPLFEAVYGRKARARGELGALPG